MKYYELQGGWWWVGKAWENIVLCEFTIKLFFIGSFPESDKLLVLLKDWIVGLGSFYSCDKYIFGKSHMHYCCNYFLYKFIFALAV